VEQARDREDQRAVIDLVVLYSAVFEAVEPGAAAAAVAAAVAEEGLLSVASEAVDFVVADLVVALD
jgi:hypothetical protein